MPQQATAQKLDDSISTSPAADAAPVIDLVHLSRQTLGDGALEIELLGLFEAQARGFAKRLEAPAALAPAAEAKQRADIAHTIKGSARAIGAFALADAAQGYEDALRSGAADPDPALRRLLGALDIARAQATRLL